MNDIQRLDPVTTLHEKRTYNWSKRLLGVAVGVGGYTAAQPYALIGAIALGVLEASDLVASTFSPESFKMHTVVKLATTAAVATITAIALLHLGGFPLTAIYVAKLAGILSAPAAVEWLLEAGRMFLHAPTGDQLKMQEALHQFGRWAEHQKAVASFKTLHEKGYAPGTFYYAIAQLWGRGIKKNEDAAYRILTELAKAGNHDAKAVIAAQAWEAEHSDWAKQDLEACAAAGSSWGEYYLAYCLLLPPGPNQDLNRGAALIKASAAKGNIEAQKYKHLRRTHDQQMDVDPINWLGQLRLRGDKFEKEAIWWMIEVYSNEKGGDALALVDYWMDVLKNREDASTPYPADE